MTRGQAMEQGGNAAFSESSVFLRSSRETLALSPRAAGSLPRAWRGPRGPRARGLWGHQCPQPPGGAVPAPCGRAGWEGRGPPRVAVGGRAGGWVGRVCIGAAWFRRGGWQRRGGGCWEPRSCGPAGPAVPPGAPRGPSRFSATAKPLGGHRGLGVAVRPPRLGGEGLFLVPLGVGLGCSGFSHGWRGSGRAQAGVSQMEAASGAG